MHKRSMKQCSESVLFHLMLLACLSHATSSGLEQQNNDPSSGQVNRCRQGCLYKFQTEDLSCLQGPACALSGFPTYNFRSLPEAVQLLCWDQCSPATATPTKINTSIQETWPLKTMAMIRQGSLVSADIAWPPMNVPSQQCLVTWEVFGGGLMGNLLTDSSTVQLSLWPETKYRVQVTCKNKVTESMVRSKPLTVDTSEAVHVVRKQPSSSTSSTPVSVDTSSSSSSTTSPTTERIPSELDQLEEEIRQNEILSNSLRHREEPSQKARPVSSSGHVNSQVHNSVADSIKLAKVHAAEGKKDSGEVVTLYESRKEITLGICAAFFVFLVIVVLFMLKLNRNRPVDKESLIDNEYDVSFLPPPLPDSNSQTIHV